MTTSAGSTNSSRGVKKGSPPWASPFPSLRHNCYTEGPPARGTCCSVFSPIQIKGAVFHPSNAVRWLGYWFTPALDRAAHFSRRLALAQPAFALIRSLTPPDAGLPPYLCHRLATPLVAPILLYGAELFPPSVGTITCLDTLWRKVQRWQQTASQLRLPG